MRERAFSQGVYNKKSIDKLQQILYCPEHHIEFCVTAYPPSSQEAITLDAAKSVASDHMDHYCCKVVMITPRL